MYILVIAALCIVFGRISDRILDTVLSKHKMTVDEKLAYQILARLAICALVTFPAFSLIGF